MEILKSIKHELECLRCDVHEQLEYDKSNYDALDAIERAIHDLEVTILKNKGEL